MTRELDWAGCHNVRDLGGLPTEGGGLTRFGAIVRADNITLLAEEGWAALHAYGIRTAVDLRFEWERTDAHSHRALSVVGVSLFGNHDPDQLVAIDRHLRAAEDETVVNVRLHRDVLTVRRDRVARAVSAVGEALRSGGVVVHCMIGKDRTGIVAALLLRLAGVSREHVADDYALSRLRVGPLVDDWIDTAADEGERAFRRRLSSAPRDAMLETLHMLESEHGDVGSYLEGAGVGDEAIELIRGRLTG